jgi:hypothetical protein
MKRLYADFNNVAADGALPLTCRGSVDCIAALESSLEPGEEVVLSDGELEVVARVVQLDDGSWEARSAWRFVGVGSLAAGDPMERAMCVPASEWVADRVVVWDWCDGAREGLCRLARPAVEFYFGIAAERPMPDDLDDRLYFVSGISVGSVEAVLRAEAAQDLAAEEAAIAATIASRSAPKWILRTQDFVSFDGVWQRPDVQPASWFDFVERTRRLA